MTFLVPALPPQGGSSFFREGRLPSIVCPFHRGAVRRWLEYASIFPLKRTRTCSISCSSGSSPVESMVPVLFALFCPGELFSSIVMVFHVVERRDFSSKRHYLVGQRCSTPCNPPIDCPPRDHPLGGVLSKFSSFLSESIKIRVARSSS